MDFHDFEKFNGQDIEKIISKEVVGGYNTRVVQIGDVDVNVVEHYDEESETIDYRLEEEEGRNYGGKLIGHATMGYINNICCFVFEASDEEWS